MPSVERKKNHTVCAAHVIFLVIIHAHNEDIDDFIIVIQSVNFFQALVLFSDIMAGVGSCAGKKSAVGFIFIGNIDSAQHHFHIHKGAARHKKHQRYKENA